MPSLLTGLGLGLLTALGFGVADFCAAVAARRIGSLRTAIGGATTAAVFLAVTIPWMDIGSPSVGTIIALLATGLVQALAYLSFYRGLATGDVSIVTPIVAAWAVIPVLAGLLIFGENIRPIPALGIALTIAGVISVSSSVKGSGGKPWLKRAPALVYGLGALLGFGLSLTMIAPLGREVGWFLPIFAVRVVCLAVLVGFAVGRDRVSVCRISFWKVPALVAASLTAIGLLDSIGYIAYAVGVRSEDVSLVSTAASISPVFTIVLACMFFGERLGRLQSVGAAAVIVGLVLIAT